jgi:dephospho-CoA kinase
MKSVVIGLTGPIASGKNTAAKIFSRRGALVIDADKIGHQVIAPQTKAWHEIVKVFGSKVLNRGGVINRRKLAKIVFSDPVALRKLNSITHPEMRKVISEKIRTAKLSNKRLIVVNAALLNEMKILPLVDKVVVVSSDEKIRVKRLIRSGLTKQEAAARMRSQAGISSYRKTADFVIENNQKIVDLIENVKRIISAL